MEQAWEVLLDMERVAPCLPGAALESTAGDEHVGTMTIKVGPVTSRYRGTVRVQEADEAARRTVMRAEAKDQRGQGTAAATITSRMEPVDGGTRVRVETDMQITGPVAQFGRGVMQDVSGKLMGRFADCLAEEIADAPRGRAGGGRAGGGRAGRSRRDGPRRRAAAARAGGRGGRGRGPRERPRRRVAEPIPWFAAGRRRRRGPAAHRGRARPRRRGPRGAAAPRAAARRRAARAAADPALAPPPVSALTVRPEESR